MLGSLRLLPRAKDAPRQMKKALVAHMDIIALIQNCLAAERMVEMVPDNLRRKIVDLKYSHKEHDQDMEDLRDLVDDPRFDFAAVYSGIRRRDLGLEEAVADVMALMGRIRRALDSAIDAGLLSTDPEERIITRPRKLTPQERVTSDIRKAVETAGWTGIETTKSLWSNAKFKSWPAIHAFLCKKANWGEPTLGVWLRKFSEEVLGLRDISHLSDERKEWLGNSVPPVPAGLVLPGAVTVDEVLDGHSGDSAVGRLRMLRWCAQRLWDSSGQDRWLRGLETPASGYRAPTSGPIAAVVEGIRDQETQAHAQEMKSVVRLIVGADYQSEMLSLMRIYRNGDYDRTRFEILKDWYDQGLLSLSDEDIADYEDTMDAYLSAPGVDLKTVVNATSGEEFATSREAAAWWIELLVMAVRLAKSGGTWRPEDEPDLIFGTVRAQ